MCGNHGLTVRQTVQQSCMIHPDWDLAMHLSYLENDEFFMLDQIDVEIATDEYNKARRS